MSSFLQELEIEREIVERNSELTIPVPPRGKLAVRFRPPVDRGKIDGILSRYRAGAAMSGDQERQLIVDCCDEIVTRNPGWDGKDPDGRWLPVDPEGGPLRFDAGDDRWGDDITANPKTTALDCVAKLYNLDLQTAVAAGIGDALMDWLSGVNAAVEAAIEGESAGGAASSATPPASS